MSLESRKKGSSIFGDDGNTLSDLLGVYVNLTQGRKDSLLDSTSTVEPSPSTASTATRTKRAASLNHRLLLPRRSTNNMDLTSASDGTTTTGLVQSQGTAGKESAHNSSGSSTQGHESHIPYNRKRRKPNNSNEDEDEGSEEDENPRPGRRGKPKKGKRFLWTEELHRMFVAAVFDVGLKHASPKALYTLLGKTADEHNLTTEHIKSHLQKFRLHSQRSRDQFLKYYEDASRKAKKMGQPSAFTVYPVDVHGAADAEMNDRIGIDTKVQADDISINSLLGRRPSPPPVEMSSEGLQRQVQMQARSIQLQAEYQEALQRQLIEQQRLQRELQDHLAMLSAQAQMHGMSMTSLPPPSNQPQQSSSREMSTTMPELHLDDHGPTGTVSIASEAAALEQKTRLQIQLAMQSQMNMHRQMLLRQAGQVALHGGSGSSQPLMLDMLAARHSLMTSGGLSTATRVTESQTAGNNQPVPSLAFQPEERHPGFVGGSARPSSSPSPSPSPSPPRRQTQSRSFQGSPPEENSMRPLQATRVEMPPSSASSGPASMGYSHAAAERSSTLAESTQMEMPTQPTTDANNELHPEQSPLFGGFEHLDFKMSDEELFQFLL